MPPSIRPHRTEAGGYTERRYTPRPPQAYPLDEARERLAGLLAEKGIRVNSVAPGPIWTPLIPATMPPEQVEKFGNEVPMKRPGQPCEVAPLFVFLASDEASYVTGARYAVTGGAPLL